MTISSLLPFSKHFSERRGLIKMISTMPLLAFLVMDGIRHCISLTSLLP